MANVVLSDSFLTLLNGTSTDWNNSNLAVPNNVLYKPDDQGCLYLGNGAQTVAQLSPIIKERFDTARKNKFLNVNGPNGLVRLDSNGLLPTTVIPSIINPHYVVFADIAERDAYPSNFIKEGMKCYVRSNQLEYRYLSNQWKQLSTAGSLAVLDLLYANSVPASVSQGVSGNQLLASVPLGTGRILPGDSLIISAYIECTFNATYNKIIDMRMNDTSIAYVTYYSASAETILLPWFVDSMTKQYRWGNPVTPFTHSSINMSTQTSAVDLNNSLTFTFSGRLHDSALTDFLTLQSLWVLHLRKLR